MKKIFLGLLLFAGLLADVKAAPGDTTWVQAQSGVWLSNYGNYDSTVTFPDGSKSYQRVFMYFTLGKYVCPGNPQYCSDWDYTVQNYLMTPTGDTLELGRLITPYANSTRMTANWKGVYAFDVTDFYPVLKNNATVRVHYSGYSGGFTADVKFAFIEGVPARNVMGIERIWKNSYNYGHGSVDINTALSNVSLTAPANAQSAEARFTITGHGGDASGCAEFCPKTYTLNLNNNQLVQQNFWRNDCGSNNYYPQNGTWVYDRAGWCPGDKVLPYVHQLTGVTGNSNFSLNATFPAYTSNPSSSGSRASYTIETNVIYFGAFNNSLDASLEDVIAPSNSEAYFRSNPLVGRPLVKVKNMGSTPITSLKIEYGVTGSWLPDYTWTGTILPLQEAEISLPEPWSLRTATGSNNTFTAKILQVNGQADQDATNNMISSKFTAAPVYDVQFRMQLKTNGSVVNGVSETEWKIFDYNDNVVAQRVNNAANTLYLDTVTLGPAIYKMVVTDVGCDGINWWAYQFYPVNPGPGYLQVRKMSVPSLPVNGYFGGDFGCGFTQYFRTDWPTNVHNVVSENAGMKAYPNPAQNNVTIEFTGLDNLNGTLQVTDLTGKIVAAQKISGTIQELSTAALANGTYIVVYKDEQRSMQTRLVIAK